jgi:hypothetical protein
VEPHADALIRFAKRTLNILSSGEDWSPDTVQDIAEAASLCELSGLDDDGMFRSLIEE